MKHNLSADLSWKSPKSRYRCVCVCSCRPWHIKVMATYRRGSPVTHLYRRIFSIRLTKLGQAQVVALAHQ